MKVHRSLLRPGDPWRTKEMKLASEAGRADVWIGDRSGVKWDWHHITESITDRLNRRIQMVKQMACEPRNREHQRIAMLFHCVGFDPYARTLRSESCYRLSSVCPNTSYEIR
jgi:hypothetical protein